MSLNKKLHATAIVLAIFASSAQAEWKLPSFSLPSFNSKTPEQIKVETEQERKDMIEICKKAIANLYNESIDYPSEFRFNTTLLTENVEEKTMSVAINYTAIKNNQPITLNLECDFAQENQQFSNGEQKTWQFIRETRSY
jgi:hypothetical protein